MAKVSIIGAGNVGATLAMRILESDLADVALLDVAEGICAGKAMDLIDASPIINHKKKITGTKDYSVMRDSDIVVITAGFPRTPGMSREELFLKNASIVKGSAKEAKQFCPNSIIIIVTNPLDSMTYIACKESDFPRNRVFGMAGVLDTARFTALLAGELNVPYKAISTYIIGSHGDTMVPVLSQTKIAKNPILKVTNKETIDRIVQRTRNRGAEIVAQLKTGSAYYGPSASVYSMVRAIIKGTGEIQCVSCFLKGEYGFDDVCIGVPARIGKNGIEKIIEIPLSDDERKEFERSVEAVRKTIGKV